ncbi:glycosyl hydrolase [Motilimonas pumila]|uniref:Glycosyl hydrolase n=2 Tax=Motilimonas pumila TaxID=2303987 RepID=A0A418YJ17_9GAMM|nr:glycosyl hydrolase [Motilimonas pumila]
MLEWSITAVLAWLTLSNLVILILYRKSLYAMWHEPVCKQAVVIFESDDWGPGDSHHAQALEKLTQILAKYSDYRGHPAHCTIGTLLSVPDEQKISQSQYQSYSEKTLLDRDYREMLQSLKQGAKSGLLSLQLHGKAHYFPAQLLSAFQQMPKLKTWLQHTPLYHELLPSELQSRWNNLADTQSIAQAVKEEVELFQQCFESSPTVAVPPTFVWNSDVEVSWRSHGITTIITPGQRFVSRQGQDFYADITRIVNFQQSQTGQTYLVRDAYFEPQLGHQWRDALKVLKRQVQLGRPCLYEMHRFNFVGPQANAADNFGQLDQLLQHSLSLFPQLCFFSSAEFANLTQHDPDKLIETQWRKRLPPWLLRLKRLPGFSKIAALSGLSALIWLLGQTSSPSPTINWEPGNGRT